MPIRRSRRQQPDETPPVQTQRRRQRDESPEEDEDADIEETQADQGSGSVQQLAKGLVRYALSCEHSRKPIKRQDINEKGEYIISLVVTSNNDSTRLTCP